MKMLVVGMDGAHQEAFQRGWTPFIENLIKKGTSADLKEDLISRGWLEIVTGETARVTGALYDSPLMNGSKDWSLKFKLSDIEGYGKKIKPIWQKLNESGHKVGIMNVPTTNPAPEVNGFFVSGGGGGKKVMQDVVPEQCHPRKIYQQLIDNGYIVDERLDSLLVEKKLYKPFRFFSRLCEKNKKRTDSFISLAQEHAIDFGFVVYKSSSNIAEFGALPNLENAKLSSNKKEQEFIAALQHYYEHFDREVQRLSEAFPDTEIILCSDHGMECRKHLFNPNIILQQLGYQAPAATKGSLYGKLKTVKHLIPFSLRYQLKRFIGVEKSNTAMTPFDNHKSSAFSICIGDWRHGIFINDIDRFGGPVESNSVSTLANQIVAQINASQQIVSSGIKAYTKYSAFSACHAAYPDILFDMPTEYATSTLYQDLIHNVAPDNKTLGMAAYTNGKLLAGKSPNALAVTSQKEWLVNNPTEDLTLIYNHIISRFGSS